MPVYFVVLTEKVGGHFLCCPSQAAKWGTRPPPPPVGPTAVPSIIEHYDPSLPSLARWQPDISFSRYITFSNSVKCCFNLFYLS